VTATPLTLTRRQCRIINHFVGCLPAHLKRRFIRAVEYRLSMLGDVDDQAVAQACMMALQFSDFKQTDDGCLHCSGDAA
jgi:hypothetical protein